MGRCGAISPFLDTCILEEGHGVPHHAQTIRGGVIDWPGDLRADIEIDRSATYGDPLQSHIAIGLAWEGIIRNRYQDGFVVRPGQLFPPDLVALMLATFKNVRAARPGFWKDSYDDAHVYLSFSERFRQGVEHEEPRPPEEAGNPAQDQS